MQNQKIGDMIFVLENNIRAVFQINETVPLNIMQVISTGCFVLLAFAQTVMADSSNKIASAPENNSGYLVIITIIILSVVAFLFFKRYKKGKFSKDLTHAQRDPFDSNKVNFDKLSPSKEKVVWGDTSQTIDLSGSGIFSVSIVGESYYQENLKQICGGYSESETDMILTAVLVYDDENQYDNKAIKVEISGKTVGHLSQADAINYRTHMLSKGWSGLSVICKAKIKGGWDRGDGDIGCFGVVLDLPTNFIKRAEPINSSIPINQNQDYSNETNCLMFYVDRPNIQDFTQVGMHVKLWTPKDNTDKVYIFHGQGPDSRLGVVPLEYTDIIISHLVNALDYEAEIMELSATTCKIKCRLFPKEETEHRKAQDKASLRNELTKAYNPKKPITLILATKKSAVKVGDKLRIELEDLDSYVNDASQWHIKFLNQTGKTVGILDNDKKNIQKILKAHFNAYLFDVEVLSKGNYLNGDNFIKLAITPYKSNDTTSIDIT